MLQWRKHTKIIFEMDMSAFTKAILILSVSYIINISYIDKPKEYQLIWQDDFDNSTFNEKWWTPQLGDGCPQLCGWGNNESQYYTEEEENIRIENGYLIIQAHKKNVQNIQYTSAKLITKNKLSWKHGKIEIKAKLPKGRGVWPAFWMLPELLEKPMKWPDDGEIDIMEHVGYNPNMIYGTIHTKKYNHLIGTQKSDSISVKNVSEQFHIYSIEWDKNKITWLLDNKPFNTFYKNQDNFKGWPFNDYKYYLIVNLAIGGDWGGQMGIDDTIFPQKLTIDYIKYYKKI